MAQVPRHIFVEEALASRAYEDTALPIGFGQTISQPCVVARMIELVLARRADALGRCSRSAPAAATRQRCLPRSCRRSTRWSGSKALHERARANLLALRLKNLRLVHGDGYAGLESAAPFQAVVVAAASREAPRALLRQLALGGRMILPQHEGTGQRLMLYERGTRGFVESELDPVRFVPMEMGKA